MDLSSSDGLSLLDRIKEKLKCRPVAIEVSSLIWNRSGFHAAVLVGFDPFKKQFILRNSWGRYSLLRKYERISEKVLEEHIVRTGYIENPSLDCFMPQ
jgi:hypothetical protein